MPVDKRYAWIYRFANSPRAPKKGWFVLKSTPNPSDCGLCVECVLRARTTCDHDVVISPFEGLLPASTYVMNYVPAHIQGGGKDAGAIYEQIKSAPRHSFDELMPNNEN